jgi:hypothetical protein
LIHAATDTILLSGILRLLGQTAAAGQPVDARRGANFTSFFSMAQHNCVSARSFLLVFACLCLARDAGAVPVVWTGPNTTFSKLGSADPTLPSSQDRLTDNVWLTRGAFEGIFNIAPGKETSYVRFTSPADTKWATSVMTANDGKTIAASNHQDLAFTDWAPAYGGPALLLGNITTHNAVVHLVTDDIFLDLMFTQFASGGNYSYDRSTPGAAPPSGDYNGNHVVDAGDYVVWRKTLNQSVSPFGSGADGNANGTIDAGDYTHWRQRFGNSAGEAAATGFEPATVPEPATVMLSLLAFLSFLRRRGR